MSYVDEVIEQVVKQNPAEPEFHQAVKEVLESLRVVVEANEDCWLWEGCWGYDRSGNCLRYWELNSDKGKGVFNAESIKDAFLYIYINS